MAMRGWAAATVFVAVLAPGGTSAEPAGIRPIYADRPLSAVPNAAAMTGQIWAPGLAEGYVPQGVAFVGDALYVSSYRSIERRQDRGPCRVYRIDPGSGRVTATLDLPPSCGHAGGLARGAPGRLWVSDTRVVYELALTPKVPERLGTLVREIRLTAPVKGSFSAGTRDALWLGGYEKDRPGRLYRFETGRLKAVVEAADATSSVPLPSRAQGAAFDAQGRLWVTRSGSRLGELLRLDPGSGAVEATYAMPAGIEDVSFGPDGSLWSLSEAGSRRWLHWETYFPVIFRIDPARLR